MSENIIANMIENAIRYKYPQYPVKVQESPEDSESFWVQVYSVPIELVKEIKIFIFDLNDTIFDNFSLLPMVKNIETTREHYPQFLTEELKMAVKEIAMEDVRDIALAVTLMVSDKLKEFGIEMSDEQDDEVYVPVWTAIEKIANYPDYRSHN